MRIVRLSLVAFVLAAALGSPASVAERSRECQRDDDCVAGVCGCSCVADAKGTHRSCPYCPGAGAPCQGQRAICNSEQRCTLAPASPPPPPPRPAKPSCEHDSDCSLYACNCGCKSLPTGTKVRCPSCPSGKNGCAGETAICRNGECALRRGH